MNWNDDPCPAPVYQLLVVCLTCRAVLSYDFPDPESREEFDMGDDLSPCCGAPMLPWGNAEEV